MRDIKSVFDEIKFMINEEAKAYGYGDNEIEEDQKKDKLIESLQAEIDEKEKKFEELNKSARCKDEKIAAEKKSSDALKAGFEKLREKYRQLLATIPREPTERERRNAISDSDIHPPANSQKVLKLHEEYKKSLGEKPFFSVQKIHFFNTLKVNIFQLNFLSHSDKRKSAIMGANRRAPSPSCANLMKPGYFSDDKSVQMLTTPPLSDSEVILDEENSTAVTKNVVIPENDENLCAQKEAEKLPRKRTSPISEPTIKAKKPAEKTNTNSVDAQVTTIPEKLSEDPKIPEKLIPKANGVGKEPCVTAAETKSNT